MKSFFEIDKDRTYRLAIVSSQAVSIINFRSSLIREMVRRGVAVYALAPDYSLKTREHVASLGAEPVDYSLSRTAINPVTDVFDTLRLSLRLRRLQLDATFAYFIKPVIYGTLAACIASVPKRFAMIEGAGYVFSDHKKLSIWRRLLRLIVVRLYRVSLAQVDRVFVLNPDDEALFIKERMVAVEKIQRIDGIGVDLAYYRATAMPRDEIVFIFVGRFIREKGVGEFVAAARRVKQTYPEVRFVMLGDIDLNPESVTRKVVDEWKASGVVECPGYVQDVRAWIARSSVFVLPSYYREGLPRSTQEAMAMGRPIITTSVPGCRETVVDGVNGFTVTARDNEALAAAMFKFVESPELIIRMGLESRRMAENRFDVHKINAVIMKAMNLG